jgi:hypothetical protein
MEEGGAWEWRKVFEDQCNLGFWMLQGKAKRVSHQKNKRTETVHSELEGHWKKMMF